MEHTKYCLGICWTGSNPRKFADTSCGIIGGINLERYEKTKQIIQSISTTRGLVWDR